MDVEEALLECCCHGWVAFYNVGVVVYEQVVSYDCVADDEENLLECVIWSVKVKVLEEVCLEGAAG